MALLPVLCCHPLMAAFEPVPESPFLQGGISSSLFPRSPMVLSCNPASLGLLEAPGLAVSASRPYGLRELDRMALAGGWPMDLWGVGGILSASGDRTYAEMTVMADVAWRLLPRVVAASGIALRHLQISGYGRATGGSLDLAAVWSPVDGIYSTAVVRSVLRTDLGSSGDPASPRSVEMALGLVPSRRVSVAVGAAGQEKLDIEYSVLSSFSPADMLELSMGIRTGPTRFWAAFRVSLSSLGMQYGYGEHSSLPGSHAIEVSWGDCGFRPEPISFLSPEADDTGETAFPLNVNTATAEDLERIPGIGPAKASAIISWIDSNGPVDSIEMLDQVPGVGPSLLQVLREYLTAE